MWLETPSPEKYPPQFEIRAAGGTELKPQLLCTQGGVTFEIELDVMQQRYREIGHTMEPDTNPDDVNFLREKLPATITTELTTRLEALSEYFA